MTQLETLRYGPKTPPAAQLVVICHGVGADGHDLIDLAPSWAHALPHAAFTAPDGPEPCDMGPTGRQWFSLRDRAPAKMLAGAASAADALDGFIDSELRRLGLPPDAYALMGFSQGAMTVLHCGLRRAVPPRAILAFSGILFAPAKIAGKPPVLLVHGEADSVVPAACSHEAERYLRSTGFDVEAIYRPALGHGIDDVGISAAALFLQRAFAGSV